GVEGEADEEDGDGAQREVTFGEDTEIKNGLAGHQLPGHEPDQHDHGNDGEHHDHRRVEPVVALPEIEDELQTAEPDHHQRDAGQVDVPGATMEGRVEEERADHEEADDTDGKVDVEDQASGPVVADPAAQRGPE